MSISAGVPAPKFELPDETGKKRSNADYLGKPLVLYFYPKDDTPGCTTQACSFRDDYSAYQDAGVNVVGISPDSTEKHSKFKEKYLLPFTLLADEGHQVCELFGVWGTKNSYGREYDGVFRTTFVIDSNGQIVKVFEKVKPADNSAEVLALLEELGKAG